MLRTWLFAPVWVALVVSGSAQAQSDYWSATDGLSGDSLRLAIHETILGHYVIPYDSTSFDTHDAVDLLDEDPNDPNQVVLLYSSATAKKDTWPDYSREHVWPRSLGSKVGPPLSDLHHLFACDANVNSARNNKIFAECEGACESHVEAPDAPYNDLYFEPPPYHKGDVARALFYLAVRYEGDGDEPDLTLFDGAAYTGCDCMGLLSDLLIWHIEDPVDDREVIRNEGVFDLQGNRNPFIDHPEWVCELWPSSQCSVGAPPADSLLWMNEIHYDNLGADVEEGVEIAGPGGVDLAGSSLVFYNGSKGTPYDTLQLSGILPNQQGGFGTRWFPIRGLQNGPVDGIALVDPQGRVAEFLSYEGTLTAESGPAAGMSADLIGVSESSKTEAGFSLQRAGQGAVGQSFEWVGPLSASPGQPNVDQTLGDGNIPESKGSVFIHEIHYDNVGADVGEGVEVAGESGLDLFGYSLVYYNGATGFTYDEVYLSGVIPAEAGGMGALFFPKGGLQNGSPDGIALIDASANVVEFLSYEGTLVAQDGPALSLQSTDIGVQETSSTAIGYSLKRVTSDAGDVTWEGPSPHSFGSIQ